MIIYAEQSSGFGLGNFINTTPTLREFAERGDDVRVYFHQAHLAEAFRDCPFFTILEAPMNVPPVVHSGMVCRRNDVPDFVHVWRTAFGNTDVRHHTYVDIPESGPIIGRPYHVVINGSGVERADYLRSKVIEPNHFNDRLPGVLSRIPVVGVGAPEDLARLNGVYHTHEFTGIREALFLISRAETVIANDCGLAHAAGAMNADLMVLWRHTKTPKNLNPGTRTKNVRV